MQTADLVIVVWALALLVVNAALPHTVPCPFGP